MKPFKTVRTQVLFCGCTVFLNLVYCAAVMKYQALPVYEQKQRILDALERHQVIVVESPTGSGKTTQMPVILHDAGYSGTGIIGVTQPRRIAALSVSEFISKQLGCKMPGLVGYKMRFADFTSEATKIKIMTDGILLQELKLDPWLTKYSVIMVDEAHERSLNIDFILGLLKRILNERSDFKVIISSATINTDLFSMYFDNCPVIKIDAITYPVTLIFDPPAIPASTENLNAETALHDKIADIVGRVVTEKRKGGILVFLPGERSIKNCILRLSKEAWFRKLWTVPLYGRLSKEEQDRVFDLPPFGKKKIVIATNIAETSITINDITTVIDSGLAKLNFYNPFTFTSSLDETSVSKSSCSQRRGRAGRTQEGTCYRLYSRKDFETRPLYTTEEIYRTDLSEVVMRMSELGVFDFENFDFISPTGKKGIKGAVETLNMLNVLEADNSLSKIGQMMCRFPLPPRQSRIIAEAVLHYPGVVEEVVIASSFLSARSPFIFPDGEEIEARKAHSKFNDKAGDFVSFIKVYRAYIEAKDKEIFCRKNFLDDRIMAEIANIKEQLELIVSDMGVPILSGGKTDDYLTCVAAGMIQFVCVSCGHGVYRSLTTEKIIIHPGSCMYKENPKYIVAGEIVRTSRMYAMSVSALSKSVIEKAAPELLDGKKVKQLSSETKNEESAKHSMEKHADKNTDEESIKLFGIPYRIKKIKGKKHIILNWEKFKTSVKDGYGKKTDSESYAGGALENLKKMKAVIELGDFTLLAGEKLSLVLDIVRTFNIEPVIAEEEPFRRKNFLLPDNLEELVLSLPLIMRSAVAKQKSKQLGFITLFCGGGTFYFRVSRGFHTALHENLASLQTLIDILGDSLLENQKEAVNAVYSKLLKF